jgi:hypothetical protein
MKLLGHLLAGLFDPVRFSIGYLRNRSDVLRTSLLWISLMARDRRDSGGCTMGDYRDCQQNYCYEELIRHCFPSRF